MRTFTSALARSGAVAFTGAVLATACAGTIEVGPPPGDRVASSRGPDAPVAGPLTAPAIQPMSGAAVTGRVGEPAAPAATSSQPASAAPTCIAESDQAFCARYAKECGAATGADNCGTARLGFCGSCTAPEVCGGEGTPNVCGTGELETTEQTLVVVRHGESRSNICSNTCGGPACCSRFACVDGCTDCYCDAFASDLSDDGWTQVQSVLPDRLAALGIRWDKILVSPAWRTQTTIKAYLEQYDQYGEIVPELDEASVTTSCARASCAQPPWKPMPYTIVDFAQQPPRLVPRPYNAGWDPDVAQNPRPQYDHAAAHREGEQVIMDRAHQYIDAVFEQGASAVMMITHHDTGGAVLGRLTARSGDYSLDHAAAYSVLKRERGQSNWTAQGLNLP